MESLLGAAGTAALPAISDVLSPAPNAGSALAGDLFAQASTDAVTQHAQNTQGFMNGEVSRIAADFSHMTDPNVSWWEKAATGLDLTAGTFFGLPQRALTRFFTGGKYSRPSEALGIENPLGAVAADIIMDPSLPVMFPKILMSLGAAGKVSQALLASTVGKYYALPGAVLGGMGAGAAKASQAAEMVPEAVKVAGETPEIAEAVTKTLGEVPEVTAPFIQHGRDVVAELAHNFQQAGIPEAMQGIPQATDFILPSLQKGINTAQAANQLSQAGFKVSKLAGQAPGLFGEDITPDTLKGIRLFQALPKYISQVGENSAFGQVAGNVVSGLNDLTNQVSGEIEKGIGIPLNKENKAFIQGKLTEKALADPYSLLSLHGEIGLDPDTQGLSGETWSALSQFRNLLRQVGGVIQNPKEFSPEFDIKNAASLLPEVADDFPMTHTIPTLNKLDFVIRQPSEASTFGFLDSFERQFPTSGNFSPTNVEPIMSKEGLTKDAVTQLGEMADKGQPTPSIMPDPMKVSNIIDMHGEGPATDILERNFNPGFMQMGKSDNALVRYFTNGPEGTGWDKYTEKAIQALGPLPKDSPLGLLTNILDPGLQTPRLGLLRQRAEAASNLEKNILANIWGRIEPSLRPINNLGGDAADEAWTRIGTALDEGGITKLEPSEQAAANAIKQTFDQLADWQKLPPEMRVQSYLHRTWDELTIPNTNGQSWMSDDAKLNLNRSAPWLEKRTGAEGYSRHALDSLDAYVSGVVKKQVWDQALDDMMPVFKTMGLETRGAANDVLVNGKSIFSKLKETTEAGNVLETQNQALSPLTSGTGRYESDVMMTMLRGEMGKWHPNDVWLSDWFRKQAFALGEKAGVTGLTTDEAAQQMALQKAGPLWAAQDDIGHTTQQAIFQQASQALINKSFERPASQIVSTGIRAINGNLIGAALDTGFKALFQGFSSFVKAGPVAFGKGMFDMLQDISKGPAESEFFGSHVLDMGNQIMERELQSGLGMEGLSEKNWGRVLNNVIFAPVRIGHNISIGLNYYVGRAAALAGGATAEEAAEAGMNMVNATSLRFGPLYTGAAFQNPLYRPFLQFSTYPIRYMQFLTSLVKNDPGVIASAGPLGIVSDILKGNPTAATKLARFAALTGAMLTAGKMMGVDLLNFGMTPIPDRVGPLGNALLGVPQAIENLKTGTVGGQPELAEEQLRQSLGSGSNLKSLIPSFIPLRYPEKIYNLVETVARGGVVDPNTGNLRYDVTPAEAAYMAFGLKPYRQIQASEDLAMMRNYRNDIKNYKQDLIQTYFKNPDDLQQRQVDLEQKLQDRYGTRLQSMFDRGHVNGDARQWLYVHVSPRDIQNAIRERAGQEGPEGTEATALTRATKGLPKAFGAAARGLNRPEEAAQSQAPSPLGP